MIATIYARYSAESGAPGTTPSASIDVQLGACRAYCTQRGYSIATERADRAISGGRMNNRPGLLAALDDVCRARGVLVCYALSRLARNTADAVAISARLRDSGANLALLDLGMDTSTPVGQCVFAILAAVAALERDQIAARMRDLHAAGNRAGRRTGRYAPFGWRLAADTTAPATRRGRPAMRLVPVASEQATLTIIRARLVPGVDLSALAAELTAGGMRCRSSEWTPRLLARLLARTSDGA